MANPYDQFDAPARQQVTPGDPLLRPKVQRAQNEADASQFDPAQSAANVRKTNAETERLNTLTPIQVRTMEAQADKARRDAASSGGWGQVDAAYAKDFVDWRASGGYADFVKQLEQLGGVITELKSGKDNITGPVVGKTPDFVSSFVNPEAITNREAVEEVVQRSLRTLLGAQFTEKEGNRLIARAYNPSLSEAENGKRVERLFKQLETMAQAKEASAKHFEQNGTLRGYVGPSYQLGNFDPSKEESKVRQRANGTIDYSGVGAGPSVVGAKLGDKYRTEFDAEASAFIDRAVRQGVPYREALSQFRRAFPNNPPLPPKEYNAALKHAQGPNPRPPGESYGYGEKTIPMSALEQGRNNLANSPGGALVGRFANSLAGGLPGILAGDEGAFNLDHMQRNFPTASLIGDVGGAVGGSIGAGRLLGAGARRLGGRTAAAAANNPFRVAVGGDALYGSMFGATQNPDNPLGGAAMGIGATLAGNAVGRGVIAPGLRAAAGSRPADAARQLFGRRPAPQAPTPGGRMVLNGAGDMLPGIRSNLADAERLGVPYSLADSAPEMRGLAGSATRFSPLTQRFARDNVAPLGPGQSERALSMIDNHLAPSGNIDEIIEGRRLAGEAASEVDYAAARAQPPVDDPVITELLNTPAGQKAAREGYNIALNEGVDPGALSMQIDGITGEARFVGQLNWRTLQYIKQGLSATVEDAKEFGKLNMSNPANRALEGLRKRFTGRLHELNTNLRDADAAFAAEAKLGNAARQGYDSTNPKASPSAVGQILGDMTPEQGPYFQRGYASSMADEVGRTVKGRNPYAAVYGSPNEIGRVDSIFPEGSANFRRVSQLEDDMRLTRNEIMGGSATQPRAVSDAQFMDGNGLAAAADLGGMAFGAPPTALFGMLAGKGVREGLKWGTQKAARAKGDAIGSALLDPNPTSALSFLEELEAMDAARRGWSQRYGRAAGVAGSATSLGLAGPR